MIARFSLEPGVHGDIFQLCASCRKDPECCTYKLSNNPVANAPTSNLFPSLPLLAHVEALVIDELWIYCEHQSSAAAPAMNSGVALTS